MSQARHNCLMHFSNQCGDQVFFGVGGDVMMHHVER
jgi:hypothetical protein